MPEDADSAGDFTDGGESSIREPQGNSRCTLSSERHTSLASSKVHLSILPRLDQVLVGGQDVRRHRVQCVFMSSQEPLATHAARGNVASRGNRAGRGHYVYGYIHIHLYVSSLYPAPPVPCEYENVHTRTQCEISPPK